MMLNGAVECPKLRTHIFDCHVQGCGTKSGSRNSGTAQTKIYSIPGRVIDNFFARPAKSVVLHGEQVRKVSKWVLLLAECAENEYFRVAQHARTHTSKRQKEFIIGAPRRKRLSSFAAFSFLSVAGAPLFLLYPPEFAFNIYEPHTLHRLFIARACTQHLAQNINLLSLAGCFRFPWRLCSIQQKSFLFLFLRCHSSNLLLLGCNQINCTLIRVVQKIISVDKSALEDTRK